ncbi:hypothetical protein NL108_005918 [Boleophthalmus pectinirostris]|uniref:opioid growth factor receptor-like n=1 Tax=Boleophthalmus pectinirostris TaxID=150288 RepID=UPI002431EF4A|nr:opioid growth factor receptor-like [Boleophthalmus pectinirostris]KAJ0068341.1 hypothetical protein NL108_005918 [Boleophthalmus pectinirostris]
MVMLLYRHFKQLFFRMFWWVRSRSFLEGMRQAFSGSWFYIVKVCLGLVVPLLAIRHWVKGPNSRNEPREAKTSVSSEEVDIFTDDEDTGEPTAPVPEPAQNNPCALTEDHAWRDGPDDFHCDYDSTWETDSDHSQDQIQEESEGSVQGGQREWTGHTFKQVSNWQSYKFERFQAAARDLQNYRHNYPNKPFRGWEYQDRETDKYPNLDFYLGNRPSLPDDVYISDYHTTWKGKYDTLESVHTYIQWLFPLQEPGVNPEASTLTEDEIKEFCKNDTARKHLLESYKLMLDFYGMELCDEKTGAVKRAWNWKNRFSNLNRYSHNNLRITRILKCLGTLGYAHYQAPLVYFFLEETLVNGELPRVKDSVLNYFLFTVLDKKERRSLLEFAYLNFNKNEEFVWCPLKIQKKLEKQSIKT